MTRSYAGTATDVETDVAPELFDRSTDTSSLMERICEWSNMERAWRKVVANKGAPGVDGMTVDQLGSYIYRNLEQIRQALLEGRYRALPVRRTEIPKLSGGVRLLGIPTVADRWIQQMVVQVLSPYWEDEFSTSSFGFRPGLCQHDAIRHVKGLIEGGRRYWVAIDLEKFFDRVHQDRLMSRLACRIQDKRVLKLIRSFLSAGVMLGGAVTPVEEGVPQGGPLSPWLSNVVLDELDKELERRGLPFARFADDIVILVGSKRAGERVLYSITRFIEGRMQLQVNREKSEVTHPWWGVFLGISFTSRRGDTRIRVPRKSIKRFRERVCELTNRSRGRSFKQVIAELNTYLRGWWNYFRIAETTSFIRTLSCWIRRRLRSLIWKQWKTRRKRVRELQKRGVYGLNAVLTGCARKGPWRLSKNKWVQIALPDRLFERFGLFTFS